MGITVSSQQQSHSPPTPTLKRLHISLGMAHVPTQEARFRPSHSKSQALSLVRSTTATQPIAISGLSNNRGPHLTRHGTAPIKPASIQLLCRMAYSSSRMPLTTYAVRCRAFTKQVMSWSQGWFWWKFRTVACTMQVVTAAACDGCLCMSLLTSPSGGQPADKPNPPWGKPILA